MESQGPPIVVLEAGVVEHALVDAEMRRLQQQRIEDRCRDVALFVEHPEVVTLGRRFKRDGVPVPEGYRTREVDRGGGMTWHGPGQLVVYPIVAWRRPAERSVSGVIERLESWILAALAQLGVSGSRDPRMHGVWVAGRKIASIGLSFQHWVTRHGLAINLTTPVGRVESLAACGLTPSVTTSLATVTGLVISRAQMTAALVETLPPCLGRTIAVQRRVMGDPPWEVD